MNKGPAPGTGVTPAAMVDAVLAHGASTGRVAAATMVAFADVMRRFALFMERGLKVRDISTIGETEVAAFIRSRRADGGKPSLSLMHNRRTVCRHLFRAGMALGLITSDRAAAVELPTRGSAAPRPLRTDEVELCRSRALFHPRDLLHPLAWALAEATARTYEIARVLVSDVDLARGQVLLGGSSRTEARTVAFTEWGLTQVARRLRHPGIDPAEPLVPFRSRKVPRASAGMAVIEVLRAGGIAGPGVRPISVVAWRGAEAYRRGAVIEDVAALLGMRSLDRTATLIGMEPGERLR
jgi:hypothetical protein